LTLHNFLYILCLGCIYYKTDLRDFSLYYVDSWDISCAWKTVPLIQDCTCSKQMCMLCIKYHALLCTKWLSCHFFTIKACTSLTFKSSLELSIGDKWKNIRDWLFIKRLTLHNFSYILCLNCIYYETDLRDSTLYCVDSWVVCCAWRIVPTIQGCTYHKCMCNLTLEPSLRGKWKNTRDGLFST
jgi:hypothetical protein